MMQNSEEPKDTSELAGVGAPAHTSRSQIASGQDGPTAFHLCGFQLLCTPHFGSGDSLLFCQLFEALWKLLFFMFWPVVFLVAIPLCPHQRVGLNQIRGW